jgi:hypothetical protein
MVRIMQPPVDAAGAEFRANDGRDKLLTVAVIFNVD